MAGQIIKLTDFAAQMTAHLKSIIDDNKMKLSISSIMVGENEASKSYFNGSRKKAADFGIDAKYLQRLDEVFAVVFIRKGTAV